MTAAVIKATYSDWRPVKGRKVLQVIFEVPLEQQTEVLMMLGAPNPAEPAWCAIAKLAEGERAEQPTNPERRRFTELAPAQQAALACKAEAFQRYISEEYGCDRSEEAATICVREFCQVSSRSEIKPGTPAAQAWRNLYDAYQVWMVAP